MNSPKKNLQFAQKCIFFQNWKKPKIPGYSPLEAAPANNRCPGPYPLKAARGIVQEKIFFWGIGTPFAAKTPNGIRPFFGLSACPPNDAIWEKIAPFCKNVLFSYQIEPFERWAQKIGRISVSFLGK